MERSMNGEEPGGWHDGGDAYLAGGISDLHLHDTYYVIYSPGPLQMALLGSLGLLSLACLLVPSKVVALVSR